MRRAPTSLATFRAWTARRERRAIQVSADDIRIRSPEWGDPCRPDSAPCAQRNACAALVSVPTPFVVSSSSCIHHRTRLTRLKLTPALEPFTFASPVNMLADTSQIAAGDGTAWVPGLRLGHEHQPVGLDGRRRGRRRVRLRQPDLRRTSCPNSLARRASPSALPPPDDLAWRRADPPKHFTGH